MLNWRVYIPFAAIVLVLFVFINLYWLPSYVEREKTAIIEKEIQYVDLLATTVIPLLLSNDLAEIKSNLDAVKKTRKIYKVIKLLRKDNRQIYPIFDEKFSSEKFTILSRNLSDGQVTYGRIIVSLDTEELTTDLVDQVAKLQVFLLSIFLAALVTGIYLQYRMISQPLNILARAAYGVAGGKYDEELPGDMKGVMKEFVSAFDQMRSSLQHKEQQISKQDEIRSIVQDIQSLYIADEHSHAINKKVLSMVLGITSSEYGFIGSVSYTAEMKPELSVSAISNLTWDVTSRLSYENIADKPLVFSDTSTLIGKVMAVGRPVISNSPGTDTCCKSMPEGHPRLKNFMAIPVFNRQEHLIGVVGLADCPEPYTEDVYTKYEILWQAIGNLIDTRNEQMLRNESVESLRAIVDNAVDAIITINDKGHIESFNKAAENIFGYFSDEVAGENIKVLMPDMYAKEHDHYIKRYVSGGRSRIIGVGERELTGLRKNGEEFPLELSIAEVRIGSRRTFTGIVRDITLRKDKEREIFEAREELSKANQRLQELVRVDGLTGIFNRRHFDEKLADEVQRAVRSRSALTLMIFDVDHFKKYNDHYGHAAGDECLVKVAQLASETFMRFDDTVARYGGEEFAVILPGTEIMGGVKMAELLLEKIRALNIEHAVSPTAGFVTISIGLTSIIPNNQTLVTDIIQSADKGLYMAKEGGRNRVAVAEYVDSSEQA